MITRVRARTATAGMTLLLLGLILGNPGSAMETETDPSDPGRLAELAPAVLQIVNLSLLDPAFAASLVPDPWIEAAVDGALGVEAEQPLEQAEAIAPRPWPIGPWRTPESLAASIMAVQPGAVVALYKALRPRLTKQCQRRETPAEACERAIRVTASRLSSASVLARVVESSPAPITPTQKELARLGEDVVVAIRSQIREVGTTLWGPPSKP